MENVGLPTDFFCGLPRLTSKKHCLHDNEGVQLKFQSKGDLL